MQKSSSPVKDPPQDLRALTANPRVTGDRLRGRSAHTARASCRGCAAGCAVQESRTGARGDGVRRAGRDDERRLRHSWRVQASACFLRTPMTTSATCILAMLGDDQCNRRADWGRRYVEAHHDWYAARATVDQGLRRRHSIQTRSTSSEVTVESECGKGARAVSRPSVRRSWASVLRRSKATENCATSCGSNSRPFHPSGNQFGRTLPVRTSGDQRLCDAMASINPSAARLRGPRSAPTKHVHRLEDRVHVGPASQ